MVVVVVAVGSIPTINSSNSRVHIPINSALIFYCLNTELSMKYYLFVLIANKLTLFLKI